MTKLFDRVDGLLVEVHPDQMETARKGRRVSRIAGVEFDVLWTPEEEAARDAEEAAELKAAEVARVQARIEAATRVQVLQAVGAKLQQLGLSGDEIEAILAPAK